jgi:predicted NBD/HSP70 family sugar kinase
LRLAPNLGWKHLDIADCLDPLLGTPLVRVDNEASLAARAELFARGPAAPPQGASTAPVAQSARAEGEVGSPALASGFIYVSGGIGIGAGIVEPGGLYAGAHGWAGEIGHVAVYPHGRPCRCGSTGCLEQYAGRRAIAVDAGLAAGTPVVQIARLAAARQPRVLGALRAAGTALGIALAGAVNLTDIPAVVLGADLGLLAPHLRETITAELRRRVLAFRWSGGETVLSSLAPVLPAMTGAALTVTDGVAADPVAYLSTAIGAE